MKIFMLVTLFFATLYANSNGNKFKNCEIINLSQLTDIVSCGKVDYLIEYRQNDEYKRGEVKKVTSITLKDVKVIKQ